MPRRFYIPHAGVWWELHGSRAAPGYVGLSSGEARRRGLPPIAVGASPAASAALVWAPVATTNDAYPVPSGGHFRATVSLSKNFDKKAVGDYLSAHGWSNVLLYDQAAGDPTPPDWPVEGDLGRLEDNHRWLRGEATRSGAPTSVDRVSRLHALLTITLSIYRIAGAWMAQASSDVVPGLDPVIIGPGPGPLGLDAGITQPVGASVFYAWQDDTDPAKLQALAATMRMGGFPIAADVLDQRALELEGQQQATTSAQASSRKAIAMAGGVASLLFAFIGAVRHRR